MLATRRRVLAGGIGLLAPLAGCTGLGGTATAIAKLEVELANGTNDRHVFHFAVETTDGLGEWESREVAPGTRVSVVRNPPETFDPIAIHGVVGEHATRGELLDTEGNKSGEVCLHIVFEYGLGEEPSILQSADIRC